MILPLIWEPQIPLYMFLAEELCLNEPSVVAVKAGTNQVLAAGKSAKEMLGKTPESIVASARFVME